jgi:hypothetical protein
VRLGDAEREALYEQLSAHAAAGRLGLDELERRVVRLAEAETREAAAAVLADLPPPAAALQPRPRRWLRFGRGHGEAETARPEWQPTGERFRDPRTGQIMRVWVDTAGGRHYVSDA